MLGGQAYLSEVYEYIQTKTDRTLTTEWKANIRGRIYAHSSDSRYYEPHMGADIFWLVGKRGKGLWGVRPEWLRANGILDPAFPLSEQATSDEDALYDGLGDQEDDYEIIRSEVHQLKRNRTRV